MRPVAAHFDGSGQLDDHTGPRGFEVELEDFAVFGGCFGAFGLAGATALRLRQEEVAFEGFFQQRRLDLDRPHPRVFRAAPG